MLKALKILCFVFLYVLIYLVVAEEIDEVQTPSGKIKGSYIISRLGKNIYSFRGIRYAEPPIGLQRFQPAIPVTPWDIVFDASEEGPSCPQTSVENQSEDCLRLNVYTTKLSSASDIVKRPVIVFFHSEGFFTSSGQSSKYGAQYLLDHDIVLVTVNYRIASLGFMSTGDSLLPGNLGLKDQVEALRWVKKNIAAFGGDPKCITIAGSWSISLHLVSPMSAGLFHRAIASSGSVTYQEPLPTNQTHLAKRQAEILGCPTDTVGNMLICLNTKTAEEFVNRTAEFREWYDNVIIQWLPVVEPEVRGVERFLPAQPIDLIKQGKFHKVPLITGVTKDEFNGWILNMMEQAKNGNNSMINDFNKNWEKHILLNFINERSTECSKNISKKFKEYYLHDKTISIENLQGIGYLYSDGIIMYAVHRLANLVVEASDQPVYYYEFRYQGPFSNVVLSDTKKPFGVVHSDDLMYIFRMSSFPEFEKNSSEIKIVERMTAIWSNFAETGNPIPTDDNEGIFSKIIWEQFTPINKKYLEIDDELVMETNLNAERMEIWDELFINECT